MMKNYKIMTLMLVVTLLTGAVLSGCEAGRPLFGFYGDMVKAWEKSYDRDSPDALTVYIEHDGVTEAPQVITSAQITNEVFDVLSSMRVTGEYISQGVASDIEPDTVTYQFRAVDGGMVEFTFKGGHAAIGDKLYICSGVEELFEIGGIDLSALDSTASPPADSMPPAQSSEYAVFSNTAQDFSFLYNSAFSAEWSDENGATIYTEAKGSIPYLLVYRNIGDGDFDARAHFEALTERMRTEYGTRLKSVGEFQTYTVSGKEMPGVMYAFTVDSHTVELLALTEHTADSVIQYTCKYLQGQGDATLGALAEAAASYQPDANYYDEGDGQGEPNDQPQPQEPQQPATNINLVEYDGGYFTVMLPEGWQIQTMGQYTTFGFRAWNPQNPDYEIFYYGNLGPLNKSYDAKNGWAGYIGNMGFPNAELNYDAPVVTMDSGSSVFYVFDELQAVSDKYGFGFSLPALGDLMPQTSIPIETAYAGASTGETMIFAGVRGSNGGACGGMFMASLWNTNPYYVGGVDMTPTSAMNVVGIIAPTEDFLNVEAVLTQAVFSLRFTEKYIQDGIAYSKAVGEAAMADNAARQAVFDRANKAWSEYFRGGPTAGGDDFNRRIDEINDMLDNIRFALD
jgi:hypothetical protein